MPSEFIQLFSNVREVNLMRIKRLKVRIEAMLEMVDK